MNVIEIIKEYLTNNGYEGLCNPDIECGCGMRGLMPCGEYSGDCEPAMFHTKEDCPLEECMYGLDDEHCLGCYFKKE